MSLVTRVESSSIRRLTQLACVLALAALAVLCLSVLYPRPLPVIFAMSAGHVIGGSAFCLYLLAVLLDLKRREGKFDDTSPPGRGNPP
jgi:hypothetical protein